MHASSFGNWGLVLAFVSVASAAACSKDSAPPNDMSVALPDMAMNPDFAASPYAGIICGDGGCDSPNICCVRPSGAAFTPSCEGASTCMGSGTGIAACDGPEDCPSSSNTCCMQVAFMKNPDNTATPQSGTASCVSNCAATVDVTPDTITFNSKLCHKTSDCAGYAGQILGTDLTFDGCCYRTEIDFRFCAPKDQAYRSAGSYFCLDN